MAKVRRKRTPKPRVLTIRRQHEDERYFHDMAERLIGLPVVVYLPQTENFQRGKLLAVGKFGEDRFRVKWTGRGLGRWYKGLWRVHHNHLFGPGKKPKPLPCATRLNGVGSSLTTTQTTTRSGSMATKSTKVKPKTAPKRTAKSGSGRGRPSPLDELTERQRAQLAARVLKLREQGVPWDGDEGICATVEHVTSAPVGRRLLIEAGGESMIRERSVNGGSAKKKAPAKKAAPARAKAKPKGKTKVVIRGRGTKSSNPSS